MTHFAWHEEAVSRRHYRDGFDCGDLVLNAFLSRHAPRNHEQGGAKTFLAINDAAEAGPNILGFYSLYPISLAYARAPECVKRAPARDIPVFRLTGLAIDRSVQGQGLGGQLLLAAGRRSLLVAAQVGGVALLIDANHARSAAWYARYGAISLPDAPRSLLLPLKTIYAALAAADQL